MFSKACEYGMRATFFVAQQSEYQKRVGVKAIAQAIESPEAFTGKIMQQLSKKGFVQSIKGPYGGFTIDKEHTKKIRINDIIALFDGEKAYNGCILGLKICDGDHPCPLHEQSQIALKNLRNWLNSKSLYEILYSDDELKEFWLKSQ